MDIGLEILVIVLLILTNGVFAMAEFALLKTNPKGLGASRAERAVSELLAEPNRFLSTVQVAITAVGTLAGALGGATLAEALGARLDTIDTIRPYGPALAVVTIWLGITFFSLILGELVPKRLALRSPRLWSLRLGRPMRALSVLFLPVVKLLSLTTNLTLRLLGQPPETEEEIVTEAEVREMISRATEQGELSDLEQQLTESVFLLDDRTVGELMTPWERVRTLSDDADTKAILATLRQGAHSRYLVTGKDLQEIQGVVLTREILELALDGEPIALKKLARAVPEARPGIDMLAALELFRETGSSIVVVREPKGQPGGILTAQDLLEAFAGRLHKPGMAPLP